MLEFIRSHQKLMQLLLMIFIVPSFILLGMEGYSQFSDKDKVIVTINKQEITEPQFNEQYKEFINQAKAEQGENFKLSDVDTAQNRKKILNQMINGLIMQKEIERLNIKIDDAQVIKYINEMPAIQSIKNTDGSINADKLTVLLEQQGINIEQFHSRIKYLLTNQYLAENIAKSSMIPLQIQENIAKGLQEKREIQLFDIKAVDFSSKVEIKADSLAKFYQSHLKEFISKPKADLEYIILSKQDVADKNKAYTPTEVDIKKYYDDNIAQFQTTEQRRASHILIKTSENKIEAKNKALKILQDVKKLPEQFGEIAKKESADTVSAQKDGDLDFFAKGAMVKAFEDTAFKLKKDEISDLVETEFGFHIIKLTDIKPSITNTLEEAKTKIIEKLVQKHLDDAFSKKLDDLTNAALDSKNLSSISKKLDLTLKTAHDISKNGNSQQEFTERRVIKAIFEEDVLKGKRNTDVIQSGYYALVARVVKFYPEKQQSFEEASADVRAKFIQDEALKLAKQNGVSKLAAAKQAENLTWSESQTITRMESKFPKQILEAIFTADTSTLPAYIGIPVDSGYTLVKLNKVEAVASDARIIDMVKQFANVYASEELQALLNTMHTRYNVKILKDVIKISLSN